METPATASLHSATPKKNVLSVLEKIHPRENQKSKEHFDGTRFARPTLWVFCIFFYKTGATSRT